MTILSVGFQAQPLFRDQPLVAAFPAALSRADMEPVIDAVGAALERDGYAVAIYPEWAKEPALQRITTVRAALDSPRLVAHPTALPPLAGSVLASLASALSRHMASPGTLIGALRTLEDELIVVAWLRSVAHLSNPSPGIVQHFLSMLPWASFGVCLKPALVKRLTRNDRSLPLTRPPWPSALLVADRDGDPSWVFESVALPLGAPPRKIVPATELGPAWWGASRLTEAVAYPVDMAALARRLHAGLRPTVCRWCGEAIAGARCPFCALAVAPERPVEVAS